MRQWQQSCDRDRPSAFAKFSSELQMPEVEMRHVSLGSVTVARVGRQARTERFSTLCVAVVLLTLSLNVLGAPRMGEGQLVEDYWAGFRAPADYFVDARDGFSGHYELDDEGVLLSIYRDRGAQRNPMFIATYAISLCRAYAVEQDSKHLEAMRVQLSSLESAARKKRGRPSFVVWEYDFAIETYGLSPPWVSGLAQGRILAAFACAFAQTQNERYHQLASLAANAFLTPVAEGGVTTTVLNGNYFEEIAKAGYRSTKVLNGHVSALQAIWLWAVLSGEEQFKTLAESGASAVLNDLPKYDGEFISYYDQDPVGENRRIAPRADYNNLHVTQLAWLYHAFGHSEFLDYALRFSGYEHPRIVLTTSHSTNALSNGPEKLGFFGYSAYWSSNEFPVEIDADLGGLRAIDAVEVWGYSEKASPSSLAILGSTDGDQWIHLTNVVENTAQRLRVDFPRTAARYLRVVVYADNGNRNVALSGIGVPGTPLRARAVAGRVRMTSLANRVFNEGFDLRGGEWLLIDYNGDRSEYAEFELAGLSKPEEASFKWSTDLKAFSNASIEVLSNESGRLRVKVRTAFAQYLMFTAPGRPISIVTASP